MLGVFSYVNLTRKGTTMIHEDFDFAIEFDHGELYQLMMEENYYVF